MSGRLTLQVYELAVDKSALADASLSEPSRVLTLLMLANMANKRDECWPSQAYLAKFTRLSVRTISSSLKDLERGGHITIKPRAGKNCIFVVHPRNHCRPTPAMVAGLPLQSLQPPLQSVRDAPAAAADESPNEPNTKNQSARPCTQEAERALEEEDQVSAEDFARLIKDPAAFVRETFARNVVGWRSADKSAA